MVLGITGASGQLGRLAALAALRETPASRVVLMSRSPADLSDFAAQGVAVRTADFSQPETLPAAFSGVDRLLLISTSNDTGLRRDQHAAAIVAARNAGVAHLAFTSMPNVDRPAHPVGEAAEEYRAAEVQIGQSGVPWTILRNAPYAELHAVDRLALSLPTGEVRINSGAGTAAFVSRADVAQAAVAVLLQGERHFGMTYDLTGPDLLTYREVTARLAAALGRTIRYADVDDATFAAEAADAGLPPPLVDTLLRMGVAIREGYFAVRTDHVRLITGQAATPLGAVLDANRARL